MVIKSVKYAHIHKDKVLKQYNRERAQKIFSQGGGQKFSWGGDSNFFGWGGQAVGQPCLVDKIEVFCSEAAPTCSYGMPSLHLFTIPLKNKGHY